MSVLLRFNQIPCSLAAVLRTSGNGTAQVTVVPFVEWEPRNASAALTDL